MPSENTHNATADLRQDSSGARPDIRDDVNLATPKDPTASQEPQTTQKSQAAKESYADYIKNLPPPFWETKTPQTKAANNETNEEAIAARVNAVCAPVTAAHREEDERRKAMSWRERWRDRRREAKESKDPDLRPVERGSRAQLNVFGVNVQEKRGKR